MVITSLDNSIIKSFASLKEKKFREQSGRYLIEGYRVVKDALPYLTDPKVLISESAVEKFYDEFVGVIGSDNVTVCSDKVFSKVSETESTQGIVSSAKIIVPDKTYQSERVLLLDRVRDPGNMGTIIRTALATEFEEIYCIDCVDPYNPKVVRSAMSAVSRVKLHNISQEDIAILKNNGYTVISADMNGENVFSVKISAKKICLAIGNEANGLSDGVRAMSDIVLSLPMVAGESLNAGVSAGVLMYELRFGNRV